MWNMKNVSCDDIFDTLFYWYQAFHVLSNHHYRCLHQTDHKDLPQTIEPDQWCRSNNSIWSQLIQSMCTQSQPRCSAQVIVIYYPGPEGWRLRQTWRILNGGYLNDKPGDIWMTNLGIFEPQTWGYLNDKPGRYLNDNLGDIWMTNQGDIWMTNLGDIWMTNLGIFEWQTWGIFEWQIWGYIWMTNLGDICRHQLNQVSLRFRLPSFYWYLSSPLCPLWQLLVWILSQTPSVSPPHLPLPQPPSDMACEWSVSCQH